MKYPWIQFFAGDWLKDPALSTCSHATRGVWIDLLCAMHELDRTGELRGTHEQLARVARCLPADIAHALTELQTTGAADVTFRNDVVTVVNRRMQREAIARKNGAIRVARHRSNVAGNAAVTAHSHSSEVRSQNKGESVSTFEGGPAQSEPSPPSVKKNGERNRRKFQVQVASDARRVRARTGARGKRRGLGIMEGALAWRNAAS